jgi:D-xylose transport system substrate-binding protein
VLDAARAKKIWTIDYDRLTLNGGANYYVSFDGEKVGQQQAYGLVNCLKAKNVADPLVAELNGSPTDNNATLFKTGYDEILQPHYDDASYTKGPDQWVPDWNNDEGGKIFAQMLQQQPKINGVLAANDGLAGAVIKVLKSKGLNGRVPVTGQDATLEGLQNLLTGDQCITIYKKLKPEAQTAARIAVQLFKGQTPTVGDQIKDPESGAYIPFASLGPEAITVNSINQVLADGFVSKKDLCKGKYATLCAEHGVK